MGEKLKYVHHIVSRHGKSMWYFRRGDVNWRLSGDPNIDRSEYDRFLATYERGEYVISKRHRIGLIAMRSSPEVAFSRAAEKLWRGAKNRAARQRCKFDLTPEWIRDQIGKSGCRCPLTGIKFERHDGPGPNRSPFSPSLDRITPAGDYTKDNVRVVLQAVNIGLSDWGEDVFEEVCEAFLAKRNSKRRKAA